MAKRGRKYYVVWEGHRTGVFETWEECIIATKGYAGAKYKSFESSVEAIEAFRGDYKDYIKKTTSKKGTKPSAPPKNAPIRKDSISVDAACSGNPGLMEYRGVITTTGEQIFIQGPFKHGTNNIGEFLALVHGLALLKNHGKHDTPIYSDSKIAIGWVAKKKCNTKIEENPDTEILFKLIDRAEKWLKANTWTNPILKWETKKWGEIPADFGRK